MEDVVDVCARRYGPAHPVMVRCGTCSVFVWTEPLRVWRRAYAEPTPTRAGWAHGIDRPLSVDYPNAYTARTRRLDPLHQH